MSPKRLPQLLVGGFVLLALTGCGSAQNPHWFYTGRTPWFFNGVWDGLWAPVLAVQDFFRERGYPLYSYGHHDGYLFGYVIGVCACVAILAAIWTFVGELLDDILPRMSSTVADAIAFILVLILVLVI